MTLTEQWKKGELPNGWYWVEGSRAEGIYAYTAEYLNNMYRPRNGERIIEQVPSYELWKAVHEQWKVLLKENTKLKELLKDCRDEIEYLRKHYKGNIDHFKNNTRLDKEINQVLGEE